MFSYIGKFFWKFHVLKSIFHPYSDEFWLIFSPIISYWSVAAVYCVFDNLELSCIRQHRIVSENCKCLNTVKPIWVIYRVLLQHMFQVLATLLVLLFDLEHCSCNHDQGNLVSSIQFVLGMFILDTWQYWIHRFMHVSSYLYKNVHAVHHELWIPYSFGALYNHPLEALLFDTLGASVVMFSLEMSCRLATLFFSLTTIKTVLDHSNYRFPLNPVYHLFTNNAAYHNVHHDSSGLKYNFSQPYFVFWDIIMKTYKPIKR